MMVDTKGGSSHDPEQHKELAATISTINKALGPIKPGEKRSITIINEQVGNITVDTEMKQVPNGNFMKEHFPAIIGIAFVVIAIVLGFSFPNPSSLQIRIILAVLSLGGGAFGTEISGMIKVDLSLGKQFVIGATGAAALFVILYFAVPAS